LRHDVGQGPWVEFQMPSERQNLANRENAKKSTGRGLIEAKHSRV